MTTAIPLDGLIGLRYVRGGRDPRRHGGVDCFGLTCLVLERLGVLWPHAPEELIARAGRMVRPLPPRAAARPGDVLVVRMAGEVHLAPVIDGGRVLHIASEVTSHLADLRVLRGGTGRLYRPAELERNWAAERDTR